MSNGYKSCDNNLCPINGGSIGPGEEAVHTDKGETFHPQCLPASALAAQLAAENARLAATLTALSRSVRTPTSPPAG